MPNLNGLNAVVTGGTSGIGQVQVSELPKLVTGKINKLELRRLYASGKKADNP